MLWISCQPGLEDVVDKVATLMSKANNLKNTHKLHELMSEKWGRSLSAIKKKKMPNAADHQGFSRFISDLDIPKVL